MHRLGRGFAEFFHRPAQVGHGFPDGNQAVPFTLQGLFSHAPQTRTTADRAPPARLLEAWAAADPGTPDEGLTVKQEIKAIHEAMTRRDQEFLAHYGGFAEAGRRSVELQRLPEAKVTEGVSLDDYSTWRALLHKSLWHVRLSPMGQGASMRNDAESIHVPVPSTQLVRLQSGADRQGASDLLVR